MSIMTMSGLMVLTAVGAYLLWRLLLRAERLFTRLEACGQIAADISGVAFLALATAIVFGASAALLFEARRLISALYL